MDGFVCWRGGPTQCGLRRDRLRLVSAWRHRVRHESQQMTLHNFQAARMIVATPELTNLILIAIMLIFCAPVGKRAESPELLGLSQTDQLRGLAILLVVLGHLWVHVTNTMPRLLFGGDAVWLFLMISGYGLMRSYRDEPGFLRSFIGKRLRRVMVPYWLATIVLVALDYLLLGRICSPRDLLMTAVGINIGPTTRYIDFVRWYITFLLCWYVAFAVAVTFLDRTKAVVALIGCAVVFYFLDYYVSHLGFYQFGAFPIGCAIGACYPSISRFFAPRMRLFAVGGFLALVTVLCYKLFLASLVFPHIPTIIFKALEEWNSMLLSFSLVVGVAIISKIRHFSPVLVFSGRISYELFLLHGAFLVKYNPFMTAHSSRLLPLSFPALVIGLMGLAYVFNRLTIIGYGRPRTQ
jgi:peptidoglycan/LPS O-acetylase OafA/YrhL